MKQKLTLLLLALFTTVGAWAATPNILALPQPGKIYYICGYNEAQGKTAYLWADETALTGNISYTKAGDYAYLWLCAKTENGYTFQNLSTGKYILSATSGRHASVGGTSANASAFKLSETVQDSKCISFQSGDGDPRWMAVSLTASKKVDRLTGSYNYYSNQWCTDYLLEEYAAQTLSHNQYYYIYCDNDGNGATSGGDDIRQYLYNASSTTIPVQTDEEQVSLSSYAWRAQQLSKDHFSFKNGSKYLAFHSLSDAAFDWNTNYVSPKTSVERGIGRVRLWGNRSGSGDRYMLVKYSDATATTSGGFADGIGSTVAKGSDWSPEFIFRVAPQTNVYKVAIKVECPSDPNAVFTYDGIDYSGDCYIYVDGNNLPGTKAISVKSSDLSFKGFYLEDGTSLGTTVDVSALTANKGVKAVFYPFKLSTNFASATWYYMTVNGEYAVTDDAAPYPMADTKQVSEKGLWAFVEHGAYFYLINYASGEGYKLDMITPATMSSVDDYNDCDVLYDNGNTYFYNDDPSNHWYLINHDTNHELTVSNYKTNGAITLEDVDWGELAKATIDAYADSHARGQYFGADESLITSTKASITAMGASFDKAAYESMDLSALTKYPGTGYYRIYNPTRSRYMGTTDGNPVTIDDATGASTVVRLEYDNENKTYKIQMQGLELDAPTLDESITLSDDGGDFTAEGTAGTGAFKVGDAYVHAGNSGWSPAYGLLGYDGPSADAASGWTVTDATSVSVKLNSDGASPTETFYATLCVPFSYTVSGATAYTLEKSGNVLTPTEVGVVPAGTPVLLQGTSATATLTISGTDYAATPLTSDLTGTYLAKTINGENDYVLGINGGVVGFYHWNSNNLGANRAYVAGGGSSVKGYVLNFDDDDATGISLTPALSEGEGAIYNLAGQRLQKMQKGINIVNGKKVLR